MNPEFLIPIFLFGGTAVVLYKFFDGRHRERIAMIEKGVNPADFKGVSWLQTLKVNPLASLKWGLLALFVGIGVFVGRIVTLQFDMRDSAYPASMLVFGGIALIIFYLIASRKLKKEEEERG